MDEDLQKVLNKYTIELMEGDLEKADTTEEKLEILDKIKKTKEEAAFQRQQDETERERAKRDRFVRAIGFSPYPTSLYPGGEAFKEELKKAYLHVNGPNAGGYADLLTTQEINILGTETTEWGTRLLIEFKWWYGERPSEARWQKITIRTYNDLPDKYIYLQVFYAVLAARERIAERTGVSQDVRY